jgi:D-alanine-D-alanine ligase
VSREVVILCGGVSSEREVSLRSGRCAAAALPGSRLAELDAEALPGWLDPRAHAVLPLLHGGWGEGGGLQEALERAGVAFAGSGSVASRLCMDKVATKARLRGAGLPVADEVAFPASAPPSADDLVARLGDAVFLKPVDQGSSVGLRRAVGAPAIGAALAGLAGAGRWMAEPLLVGRELTVGLLDGAALGVVEILTPDGVYDYASKYTPGGSRHLAPADLPPALAAAIARAAEAAFAACGCRDFARVDLVLGAGGRFSILEINTLPGMTETSLLPDSARCRGIDYAGLVARMAAPALRRAEKGGAP